MDIISLTGDLCSVLSLFVSLFIAIKVFSIKQSISVNRASDNTIAGRDIHR